MQLPNKQICILNEDMYLAARNICNKSLVLGGQHMRDNQEKPLQSCKKFKLRL